MKMGFNYFNVIKQDKNITDSEIKFEEKKNTFSTQSYIIKLYIFIYGKGG
jgi:hypothetical protein